MVFWNAEQQNDKDTHFNTLLKKGLFKTQGYTERELLQNTAVSIMVITPSMNMLKHFLWS